MTCDSIVVIIGLSAPFTLCAMAVVAVLMLTGVIPMDVPPVDVDIQASVPFDWLVYAIMATLAMILLGLHWAVIG